MLKTFSRHVLKTSSRRLEDQQMFAGQLLEMFDNVYKKQWKDIIEKKLTAISETETFVISKTQMTSKKQLTMKLLRSKWYIEQEVPKYQI